MMRKKADDKPIPMDVLERTARVLRVLAHPHRLKIVELLAGGELAVGELAQQLEIAPNACSQHLTNMRAHGILDCRRNGKAIYYEVVDPNALNVLGCIRKHAC